jgi:hypothetical protein
MISQHNRPDVRTWSSEASRADELADRLLRIRNLHSADGAGLLCFACGAPAPCPTAQIAAGLK